MFRRYEKGIAWIWYHDGESSVWTQYWPSGIRKYYSEWKDFQLEGEAISWSRTGKCVRRGVFKSGLLQSDSDEDQSKE